MQPYFKKHLFKPISLPEQPASDLNMVVVIPCFIEPAITTTLDSLSACRPCSRSVEVIIVINAAAGSPENVAVQNEDSYLQIIKWNASKGSKHFRLFVLRAEDLPEKHAGVGLARKVGMDEAAWRLEKVRNKTGIIVCLDADCTVEENYLQTIEQYFISNPHVKAASVHFEHPLPGMDERLRAGIVAYELHLRYYMQALRYAGYPFAFHTIGSSMCVRSDVYQSAGGMNRRKAGEDFYFLHKIIPLGGFGVITGTCVFPSARISGRVPFGTGKAMGAWMKSKNSDFLTYNIAIYDELRKFMQLTPSLRGRNNKEIQELTNPLSDGMKQVLEELRFSEKMEEINANTATGKTFRQRFLQWLDGFIVLKLIHLLRDQGMKDMIIQDAAMALLVRIGMNLPEAEDLLATYRRIDKEELF